MDAESHSETLRKEAYKQFVQLGIYQKYLRPDDVERILIESGVLTTPERTFHSDMDTLDYQEDSDGQQSPCSSDKFCYSADGRFDSAEPDEAKIFGQHSGPATEDELRPSTFPMKLIQGIRNPIIEDVLIAGRCDASFHLYSFVVHSCPREGLYSHIVSQAGPQCQVARALSAYGIA